MGMVLGDTKRAIGSPYPPLFRHEIDPNTAICTESCTLNGPFLLTGTLRQHCVGIKPRSSCAMDEIIMLSLSLPFAPTHEDICRGAGGRDRLEGEKTRPGRKISLPGKKGLEYTRARRWSL